MNILAVFAHPDDELGCIGSLKKHSERGDKIKLLWTTHGELASQFVDESDEEVRRIRKEHGAKIAEMVGGSYQFFNMGDSRMKGSRDEALDLARIYATFQPDVVITWSDDHPHPDHRMTAKIAFDAVTLARIPKILNERSEETFAAHRKPIRFYQYVSAAFSRPVIHLDISEQIETAVEAFELYQSFYGWDYTPQTFKETKAYFGREVGVKFAEKLQLRAKCAPALEYLA